MIIILTDRTLALTAVTPSTYASDAATPIFNSYYVIFIAYFINNDFTGP